MVAEIRVLALDIDGVVTDGTGIFTPGQEYEPRFDFHDLDAIAAARRAGYTIAFVTGEDTDLVDRVASRFGIEHVIRGAKDKVYALEKLADQLDVSLKCFCYIGDGDRDAPALSRVGLGLATANATPDAKAAAHRLLSNRGGAGAVAEAVSLLERLKADSQSASGIKNAIKESIQASIAAHERLLGESVAVLVEITQALIRALSSGNKILLFGNGGSAADAQHVAAELVGRFAQNSDPWPAIALTTDTSVLTCVANDWEYAEIFSRQVRALAKPNDVVVGISTSGSSPNVLRALESGRKCSAVTIGFTGAKGSRILEHADICFRAPSAETPRIQELHLLAWHSICAMVEQTLISR